MRRTFTSLLLALLLAAAALTAAPASASVGFLGAFGAEGAGDGQLNFVEGVATDAGGYIYVADQNNYRVQVFSPAGAFVARFDAPPAVPGAHFLPFDVAVDQHDGSIYVAEMSERRIVKFSGRTSGAPYSVLGSWPFADATGAPNFVYGVAVAPSGDVYAVGGGGYGATNPADERVNHYSSSGAPIGSWGSLGSGPGQFQGYMRVGVDSHGSVYVTDYSGNRVEKFTPTGDFLFAFGAAGSGPGQLYGAYGVTIDTSDNVYVGQTGVNYRIAHYTAGGLYVDDLGGPGAIPGEFTQIDGVAVDQNCNLFATDTSGVRAGVERVVKLGQAGPPSCRAALTTHAIDTLEPVVTLLDSYARLSKSVELSVRCPGQSCTLDASAAVQLGRSSAMSQLTAKTLRLDKAQRGKLKLRTSRKTLARIRSALKNKRRLKLHLTFKGVDQYGNGVTRTKTLSLKSAR